MKNILVLHLNDGDETSTVRFLDEDISIRRIGCGGDADQVRTLIETYDGQVDAIALEGYPAELELGGTVVPHTVGSTLAEAARQTPVVDGGGIRPGIERWGVILADRQGRVLLATPRAAELLGVAPDSLRESWLPALLPPLETALDRGEAMQCSLHRPQGTLELGVQPVATATDGQPNLVVTLAKLAKAGDDRPPVAVPPELVRELAAATADSLSRPLGGMSLMAQTLLRDATLPPGPRKHLVRLADELEKIARRLQPLSERTAAIAPENRPLDAAAAIDRALAEWTAYAKVRDLQIDRSGLADDIRIAADPQHFARLLHHLIANAFDAMPDGGTLTLTSQPRADRLEIVLEDRGEGIAEAALPTLFDAFQGSRGDHAGLGLASVRRILAAQGAEISVASAVGQGTRIRVSWPLADD